MHHFSEAGFVRDSSAHEKSLIQFLFHADKIKGTNCCNIRKKKKKKNNSPDFLCWSQDNIWIAEKDNQSFSVFSHKILK